jgi:phosphohistidine phosphatase
MQLLLIRHAKAEDALDFAATGQPGDLRPLTDAGRKKMRRAVRGLHSEVESIDVLASSPLLRARQTAGIVAEAYAGCEVEEVAALAPGGDPEELLSWLRGRRDASVVAIVGHEPDLGELAGRLICGHAVSVIALKKGAACLLDLDSGVTPGLARLAWSLTASQLAALKD